ncbi:MAG: hypothetical protein ABI823_07110 [Bryobacteraceae bacterium]
MTFTLPGRSFEQIQSIVYDANEDMIFSDELFIGLFWEESIFNNKKQVGGTAVGFGQIEPAEFWQVKKYGVSLSVNCILHDDMLSARAVVLYLRHLTNALGSTDAALRGYAGYKYDHAAWRLAKIAGWKACANALQVGDTSNAKVVKDALYLSRTFPRDSAAYDSALFS